ncbi:TPA: hypothetical protein ACH3X2_012267 [Trebouxia sp. C0005]
MIASQTGKHCVSALADKTPMLVCCCMPVIVHIVWRFLKLQTCGLFNFLIDGIYFSRGMAALNVGTTEAMQRQHASDADCFALPARSLQQALYSLYARGMVTVMALLGFVDNLSYLY